MELRYTATIAFNLYAESDEQAIKKLKKLLKKIEADNVRALELEQNPFASFNIKKVQL
jgi:hypothetical protein